MLGIMKSQVHINKMLKVILFALFAQYLCTDFSGASDRMFVSALSVKPKKIQNQDPSGETIEYNQKLSEKPEHVWGGSVDKSGKYPMNANSENSFTEVNSINGPVDSGNTLMETSKNDNCQDGGSCGNPKSAETKHKEPDSKPDHSDGYSYGNMHRRAISIGTAHTHSVSTSASKSQNRNGDGDEINESLNARYDDGVRALVYIWKMIKNMGKIRKKLDRLRQGQFDNGTLHIIDSIMKGIRKSVLNLDDWNNFSAQVICGLFGSIGLCMVASMLTLMIPAWYVAKASACVLGLGVLAVAGIIIILGLIVIAVCICIVSCGGGHGNSCDNCCNCCDNGNLPCGGHDSICFFYPGGDDFGFGGVAVEFESTDAQKADKKARIDGAKTAVLLTDVVSRLLVHDHADENEVKVPSENWWQPTEYYIAGTDGVQQVNGERGEHVYYSRKSQETLLEWAPVHGRNDWKTGYMSLDTDCSDNLNCCDCPQKPEPIIFWACKAAGQCCYRSAVIGVCAVPGFFFGMLCIRWLLFTRKIIHGGEIKMCEPQQWGHPGKKDDHNWPPPAEAREHPAEKCRYPYNVFQYVLWSEEDRFSYPIREHGPWPKWLTIEPFFSKEGYWAPGSPASNGKNAIQFEFWEVKGGLPMSKNMMWWIAQCCAFCQYCFCFVVTQRKVVYRMEEATYMCCRYCCRCLDKCQICWFRQCNHGVRPEDVFIKDSDPATHGREYNILEAPPKVIQNWNGKDKNDKPYCCLYRSKKGFWGFLSYSDFHEHTKPKQDPNGDQFFPRIIPEGTTNTDGNFSAKEFPIKRDKNRAILHPDQVEYYDEEAAVDETAPTDNFGNSPGTRYAATDRYGAPFPETRYSSPGEIAFTANPCYDQDFRKYGRTYPAKHPFWNILHLCDLFFAKKCTRLVEAKKNVVNSLNKIHVSVQSDVGSCIKECGKGLAWVCCRCPCLCCDYFCCWFIWEGKCVALCKTDRHFGLKHILISITNALSSLKKCCQSCWNGFRKSVTDVLSSLEECCQSCGKQFQTCCESVTDALSSRCKNCGGYLQICCECCRDVCACEDTEEHRSARQVDGSFIEASKFLLGRLVRVHVTGNRVRDVGEVSADGVGHLVRDREVLEV